MANTTKTNKDDEKLRITKNKRNDEDEEKGWKCLWWHRQKNGATKEEPRLENDEKNQQTPPKL